MQQERENWINNVLNSTERMERVQPAPFLYTRVIARISKKEERFVSRKPQLVFAGTLLLLLLNITLIISKPSVKFSESSTSDLFMSELNLSPTSNW